MESLVLVPLRFAGKAIRRIERPMVGNTVSIFAERFSHTCTKLVEMLFRMPVIFSVLFSFVALALMLILYIFEIGKM